MNQKIAWFYLLQNNQAKYEEYMRKVTASGATFMDSDKIAENDAKSGLIPNSSLLKVRLNSDGGYFTEALLKLNSIKLTSLTFEEKIEYYYRNARIQQLSKLYDLSLLSYQQVIKIAQGSTSYYAPKSCLEMPTIYEKNKKNYPLALQYYQKVLTYKNHSYKNSLDQQAKAGLSRLKN